MHKFWHFVDNLTPLNILYALMRLMRLFKNSYRPTVNMEGYGRIYVVFFYLKKDIFFYKVRSIRLGLFLLGRNVCNHYMFKYTKPVNVLALRNTIIMKKYSYEC